LRVSFCCEIGLRKKGEGNRRDAFESWKGFEIGEQREKEGCEVGEKQYGNHVDL